jgi:hypothetical protein
MNYELEIMNGWKVAWPWKLAEKKRKFSKSKVIPSFILSVNFLGGTFLF